MVVSDHKIITLHLDNFASNLRAPFKYINAQMGKESYKHIVFDALNSGVKGCYVFTAVAKLKKVKATLQKMELHYGWRLIR